MHIQDRVNGTNQLLFQIPLTKEEHQIYFKFIVDKLEGLEPFFSVEMQTYEFSKNDITY